MQWHTISSLDLSANNSDIKDCFRVHRTFREVHQWYCRSAESLARFEILSEAFATIADFQPTLDVFYADILGFYKHVYKFVRQNGWKQMHVIPLRRREEWLSRVKRIEEEQTAKHHKAITSWLKTGDSEQLFLFESVSGEGAKYPGTCGWFLKNSKVKSWFQRKPDNQVLWLQGKPRSRKSVISTQVVKFIQAAQFLQTSASSVVLKEQNVLAEHAVATITCLLSGLEVFGEQYDESRRCVRLVKGLHDLHVYATEHWSECLLSSTKSMDEFLNAEAALLAECNSELSTKISPLFASALEGGFTEDGRVGLGIDVDIEVFRTFHLWIYTPPDPENVNPEEK
ncbi:uncharacterized protein BDR25DRAFT_314088 [Lindgomyces ingoldianus]|uniref:Uncharacterized protein n=1 Tax=Lindgomyces ingoldianus TaxID=673940 RepID=A0ACB6QX98_9PLEO|nr:uncharacterized protein BDR25DRAFT_314088 [Lindgomyces ingoldianus]KAF2470907.1 hypothetical protein BDR25DRAFT_314088 [Lindgomyces ingoldianus]